MKKILAVLVASLVSSFAIASDHADESSTTVDTSKNPITGSVTTTKKHKRKMKNGKDHAQVDVTEKTKVKANGDVEKTIDVNTDSAEHK